MALGVDLTAIAAAVKYGGGIPETFAAHTREAADVLTSLDTSRAQIAHLRNALLLTPKESDRALVRISKRLTRMLRKKEITPR